MSIANQITRINTAKADIKEVVNQDFEKIQDETITYYPEKIAETIEEYKKYIPQKTVSGTEINIDDAAPIVGKIKPKANTYQKQLSGKNKWSVVDYNDVSFSLNSSPTNILKSAEYFSFTSNNEQTNSGLYIKLDYLRNIIADYDSTKNYVVSCDVEVSADTTFLFGISSVTTINLTAGKQRVSIQTQIASSLKFYNKYAAEVNYKISNIQIEESPEATSYEQFCGGQASPNPDYPQPIKVVTGNNVIKHVGKNLWGGELEVGTINLSGDNETKSSYSRSKNFINVNENSDYTISSSINERIALRFYDENGRFLSTGSTEYTPNTFTTPANCKKIRFVLVNNNDLDTQVQLEEGTTTTPYEPYKEKDYNLNLGNIELCKKGNSEDVPFKNEVVDENYNAELEGGAWYKKKVINKRILDGSENWAIWEGVFLLTIINDYKDRENTPICDYYKGIANVQGTANMTTNNTIAFNLNHSGLPRFFVKDERFSNVEDFKNWLSTHNIELYYDLATPNYTKITDPTLISQLEALNKAKWFKGVNHIWTETENIEPVLEGTYRQAVTESGV